ncbi:MAG: hypothetical protein SGPRY_000353, partial [Prymnesium sp.]
MGWQMRLGKVSRRAPVCVPYLTSASPSPFPFSKQIATWSEMIMSFSETCALFNEKLMPAESQPDPEPIEKEKLK